MKDAGRAGDSNLNFKRHRGHIMNAHGPFFDLVTEVPVCIDADLNTGDSAQDAELVRGFAEYFHDLQFGWRGWDDTNQLRDLQMLLHGPGVVAWEDEWDWRPQAILADNFYVADGTNASMDNGEIAMISTTMSAGKLWRKIENEAQGTVMGWDSAAVRETIMDSARNGQNTEGWQWGDWERAFKRGDHHVSQTLTKPIRLFVLFVEEMDGTISERILPVAAPGSKKLRFLYESPSNRECWDEAICVFPYDIGADGTFHGIKGMGTDIFPFCELLNKIDNAIADLAVMGIKPMWQPSSAGDLQKWKMVKVAGGNMVPHGMNPLDLRIGNNITPGLEISREFSTTLSQNIAGHSPQDLAAPTVEETAKSAMIRAAERAKTGKGTANRYMRSMDRQYAETWRRAINPKLREHHPGAKEALKFQRKCRRLCEKMGVEWERPLDKDDSPTGKAGKFTVLQLVENIRANRSLGLGNAALRIEIVQQFMANIDRFDEIGQNEIKRRFVAVLTSFHDVDAIVPSLTTGRDTTNDEALACQEDNAFAMLGEEAEATVVPGQNHVLHLGIHVPSMEDDQQSCEKGEQDPRECFKRLESKGKHSHEHLAVLAGNPSRKREATEFGQRLAELAAYQDHLQQTIAEQDAANPVEQPDNPSPDMVKVRGTLALKAQTAQGNHELKVAKTQADLQLKTAAQQAEEARKNATTAATIRRDTIQTAADIAHQRTMAEASSADTAE